MSDRKTLAVYAAEAETYSKKFNADTSGSDALQCFLAALPERGHVLDLGSGPGRWAGAIAEAGHSVEAWDAVPEMVALAAEKPGVTAKVATFDDLSDTDAYDGIWANFSLLHAPRADVPRYLAAMRQALRPSGVFHMGVKLGTGEKRDSIGRLYTYFEETELEGMLTSAGFAPTHRFRGESKGLDGAVAAWIILQSHA